LLSPDMAPAHSHGVDVWQLNKNRNKLNCVPLPRQGDQISQIELVSVKVQTAENFSIEVVVPNLPRNAMSEGHRPIADHTGKGEYGAE
jgi:hypothetical protein